MRGASALNDLLAEFPDARLRVLAVWEPVLATDVAAPTTGVLGRLHDRRVRQYWDPQRVLSADVVRAINAEPGRYGFEEALPADFIVWDVVAVFDVATRWDRDLPVPLYHGGPVVDVIEDTRRAISAAMLE